MKKEGARRMKGGAAGATSTWVCKVLAFLLACATVGEVSAQTGTTVALDRFATTITMSPALLELPENGRKSYTLTVNKRPVLGDEELDLLLVRMNDADHDVEVIPKELRFTPDNWSEERTITVHGVGDLDRNDDTAQIIHSATGYTRTMVSQEDDWQLRVNIFDVDSLAMTVVSANQEVFDGRGVMQLPEGESGTYEVILNRRPPDDVTVTVTVEPPYPDLASVSPARLTFTSANWNSPREITVQALPDDDDLNEGPLYIGYELTSSHHATPRRFNWHSIPRATGVVALNIIDDEPINGVPTFGAATFADQSYVVGRAVTVMTLPAATGGVGELLYTLSPSLPPGLSFDASSRVLSGTPTTMTAARTYTYTVTDANGATDNISFTIEVTVPDERPAFDAGTTIAPKVYVRSREIAAEILPEATGGDETLSYTIAPVLPSGLSFDPQTRTLSGTPTMMTDVQTYTYTVSDTDGDTDSLSFTIVVVSALAVTVTPAILTVAENGGLAAYKVKLSARPSANVSVTLTSAPPNVVTVSERVLTFTPENWNTEQTVTVTGVDDAIDNVDDERVVAIIHTGGDGQVLGSVEVTVTDDDTPGVTISTGRLELNEGETGTYTVKLNTRPARDVTVFPSSSDDDIVTVEPETRRLDFTTANWNTAQTVTVRAVRVRDTDPEAVTLSHRVINYGDVTDGGAVTVILGDATIPGLAFSTRLLELNEGGTVTYTVKLRTRPSGNVTVSVQPAIDDSSLRVSPETLIFTAANWNAAQTVTLRAMPDDTLGDGEISTTRIDHRVTGYGNVTRRDSLVVRITHYGHQSALPKPGVIDTIKGVIWRRIIRSPIEIIGPGRNKRSVSGGGVRGFRSDGGATVILDGQTLALGEAAPAAELDADWRSTPSADSEGENWWSRSLGVDDLLRSSAFELTLGTAEDGAQGGGPSQLTLWGQGDVQFFDSKPGAGTRYDGNLKAGYLGIETWFNERWLAGVAVSRTKVATDYQLRAGSSNEDGRLDVTLTTAYPYFRIASDPQSEFWMLLGRGWGEATNKRENGSVHESSDVRTIMVAGGARRVLTTKGNLELALLGDAGYGQLSSSTGPQLIDDLSVDSWQVRLGVEGSHTTGLKGGSSLTPFVEVAGRYDGGGGNHDAGLEIASGVSWTDPASGFGVVARGRVMVLHSTDSYREYGASLTASLSPGTGGEGLSLSLSPRLGAVTKGADALWREGPFRYATSAGGKAMSLSARVGYGIRGTATNSLLTPFGELDLGERGDRRARMGIRFDREGSGLGALSLELSGERRESGSDVPEQRIDLTGRLRF